MSRFYHIIIIYTVIVVVTTPFCLSSILFPLNFPSSEFNGPAFGFPQLQEISVQRVNRVPTVFTISALSAGKTLVFVFKRQVVITKSTFIIAFINISAALHVYFTHLSFVIGRMNKKKQKINTICRINLII